MNKQKAPPKEKTGNAVAHAALAALDQIEADAAAKRLAQLESLNAARAQVQQRVKELAHQVEQIERVVATVTGRPAKVKGGRRDLSELRRQVSQMLGESKGRKFKAGDIARAIPAASGTAMTVLLGPLIKSGVVKVDASRGVRNSTYFCMED